MASSLHHTLRPGSGPVALLLIHPLGADLSFWDAFVEGWAGPEPILACDLRSAGRSPRAAQPVTPREHAADLDALRRALGLEKVVPVGCAIGAMVAACYAADHPEATAGLVLSNPALKTSPQARTMLAERADLVRSHGMAATLPGAVERAFLHQERDERYAHYYAQFAAQDPEAYALSALAVLDADISSDLARVRCPSLTVAGAHDVLLPPDLAHAVHGLLKRSRFELVPDAAHFVPYQKPQRFRDLVADFLKRDVIPGIGAADGALP